MDYSGQLSHAQQRNQDQPPPPQRYVKSYLNNMDKQNQEFFQVIKKRRNIFSHLLGYEPGNCDILITIQEKTLERTQVLDEQRILPQESLPFCSQAIKSKAVQNLIFTGNDSGFNVTDKSRALRIGLGDAQKKNNLDLYKEKMQVRSKSQNGHSSKQTNISQDKTSSYGVPINQRPQPIPSSDYQKQLSMWLDSQNGIPDLKINLPGSNSATFRKRVNEN